MRSADTVTAADTVAARDELSGLDVDEEFAAAVVDGLAKRRKTLPCRYFYDARGSALFEDITRLPEYYPSRTEMGILKAHADEMIDGIGEDGLLVEFGSGSSLKTEILLDRVAQHVAYVAIDVSETALTEAEARLARRYPDLDIRTIVADFSHLGELPRDLAARRTTGFFPGSTLGNLASENAKLLLASFGKTLGKGSRLIIGIDLKKDARKLVNAYNDAAGVTAAFNLNLLTRINRELGAAFDRESFRHEAVYNPREGRVEMHLVSTRDHDVELCGRRFHFSAGESIHTESSYKYTVAQFQELALSAGWEPKRVWMDADKYFSVHELVWP
jgi:dimethylhistidine N-methyltransferase